VWTFVDISRFLEEHVLLRTWFIHIVSWNVFVCNPFYFPKGVMTAMEAHNLRLSLSCPTGHHHYWSLSKFDFLKWHFTVKSCHLWGLLTAYLMLWSILWLSKQMWKCFPFLPSFRPGSLKRGMTSLAEDALMKRSRTSSISSGSGVHTPRGTPGSRRNPIQSSYSSSKGLSQVAPIS